MFSVTFGRETLLVAMVAVHFLKSTFLQVQIKGGTLTETKSAYGRLVCLAEKQVDKHVAKRAANQSITKSILMHGQEDADGRVVDTALHEPEPQHIFSGVPQQS